MRAKILLLALLMPCLAAASAFAQAVLTVGSIPITAATATGQTEHAGDISFTMVIGSPNSVDGKVTVNYGAAITIPLNMISVTGNGGFTGKVSLDVASSSNIPGKAVINVTGGATYPASFVISGTRVGLAGTGFSDLIAGVSSTGNSIVAGQSNVPVILFVTPGLSSVGGSAGVMGEINAATGGILSQPVAAATEGYRDAFKAQGEGDTTSVIVRFTLGANPPAGIKVSFPPIAMLSGNAWVTVDSSGGTLGTTVEITDSSSSLNVYYKTLEDNDVFTVETLAVPVTLSVSESAALPLQETSITYTASLAPVGPAFNAGQVITSPIPRFEASEVGPAILFVIKRSSITFDADGDGKSDIAVWRPDSGVWYVRPSGSAGNYTATRWGMQGDKLVAGDYDGDGKSDLAVWRPDTKIWYILSSGAQGTYTATQWGLSSDTPVQADYDGDGKSDIAVWRPEGGMWYIRKSGTPGNYTATPWGMQGDMPVPGDYDADGKADIAVLRNNGIWYILSSGTPGTYTAIQWGISADTPVPADYDGDKKADLAVWRSSEGTWYILSSANPGTYTATKWGVNGDVPVSGDYDGDGKADIGIWRPSAGAWYILSSANPGTYTAIKWGVNGDEPVSALP